MLLCCLWRCASPEGSPRLPLWVFCFCAGVECLQLLELPKRWGFGGTPLAVALGTSFDWRDLLCYAVGCAVFTALERWILRKQRT